MRTSRPVAPSPIPRFEGWPVERLVPAAAATVVSVGLVLGETRSPYWRLLSAFTAANLALYATAGWCPASLAMHRLSGRRHRLAHPACVAATPTGNRQHHDRTGSA